MSKESIIYSKDFKITKEHIDINGHVNNVNFVQWMQDIAYEHVNSALGDSYVEENTWFVREHNIEYKMPAFLDDEIRVETYIDEVKKVYAIRKYRFINKKSNKLIAKAMSNYVCIDKKSGRPTIIDDNFKFLFFN